MARHYPVRGVSMELAGCRLERMMIKWAPYYRRDSGRHFHLLPHEGQSGCKDGSIGWYSMPITGRSFNEAAAYPGGGWGEKEV